MKFFLVIFIFITNSLFAQYKYELSICSIFQNDAKYLPEWIEFHQDQGVEHFFLYNNLSSDNYKGYLEPYIRQGVVELIEWPHASTCIGDWNGIQCRAYIDCIDKHRKGCHWIAFLDTDEFLFSPDHSDLRKVLKDYNEYAGVSANWVLYGSSFVESIQANERMLDLLVWRSEINIEVNKHVKTIVQPRYVSHCENPHYFIYYPPFYAVTENREYIHGPFSKTVSVNKLRINHYWQRDLDFYWNVKVKRQRKWGNISEEMLHHREIIYNDVFDDILSGHRD